MADEALPWWRSRALDRLLAVLWLLELVHLAWPEIPISGVLVAGLLAFVAVALVGMRWQTLLLCSVLATLALTLSIAYGTWRAIFDGVEKALIFAAFMPTIMLVRATADLRPEIASARTLFSALERRHRGGGLLFGLHVIASVLSIGVFAVLASVLGPGAPDAERRRLVGIAIRTLCLCSLWSPFFVGMGLATQYIPSVELWQIMPLGLVFSLSGLLLSFLLFERAGGMTGLVQSLKSLIPVVPSVAAAALSVVVLTALTTLSTLQALVVAMPILCAASLLAMGRGRLGIAVAATDRGLGNIRGEVCILTLAVTLGAVIEASLVQTGVRGMVEGLAPSPISVIAFVIGTMVVAGLLGFHPIVSLTVLLVVFAGIPVPVVDLVMIQTMLVGWGLGAMVSVSGISVVTASAMFSIPPERLIRGDNLLFAGAFGTIAVLVLTAINAVLAP